MSRVVLVVSKAARRSRATANVLIGLLASRLIKMWLLMAARAVTVPCPARNPCWWGPMSAASTILGRSILSVSFAMGDSRLIGRYPEKEPWSFPGLWMGMTRLDYAACNF